MSTDTAIQDYLNNGGTIHVIRPGATGITPAPPTSRAAAYPYPSARNCRACEHYHRGRGDKIQCLKKCRNYKQLLGNDDDMPRDRYNIPMVQEIIEGAPAVAPRSIQALMQSLPAPDAAVLTLRYYGQLSVREIADYTGRTTRQINRQLAQSVSRLKKIITEQYQADKRKNRRKMS